MIAVPPAETRGWYPRPSDEATETIIPPLGYGETPTSDPTDVEVPLNVILVIPEASPRVYWFATPGVWNTSLTNIIAFSVEMPETLDSFWFRTF